MESNRFRGHGAAVFAAIVAASVANAQVPLAAPDVAIGDTGRINAIARQSDGSLIIGGEFTRVERIARRNLARLHPDGSLDTTWNASTDNAVSSIAIDAHDDVLVGGAFEVASGQPRAHFAKFAGHATGAVDPAWNPGTSVSARYSLPKLALRPDGSVFAFQSLFHNDTIGDRNIVKMSSVGTGTVDFSWNPTVPYVAAIAADRSGALYIGAFGNDAEGCVRKVSSSGSGTAIAGWHVSLGRDCRPWELATSADGSLYASSTVPFEISGGGQRYIVRFAPGSAGEIDMSWSPDVSQPVLALAVGDDAIHVNLNPGGPHVGAVARLSPTTGATVWQVPAAVVYALAVGADNSVYAGAEFEEPVNPAPGGQAKLSLARLAGTNGAALPTVDATRPGSVRAIARQPDGGLIVGGRFARAGTTPRRNLLRLRPDGTLDADWNAPGTDDEVAALAVDADGDVFAGLTAHSDTAVAPIRRYAAASGMLDPTWSASVGGNGDLGVSITSLLLDGHGYLYVGGEFERVGGAIRPGLARFAVQGGTLDAWNPPAGGTVLALAPDGALHAAGASVGVIPGGPTLYSGYLHKIDTASNVSTLLWTLSFVGNPLALAVTRDGAVFAGGNFESGSSDATSDVLKVSAQGQVDAAWMASAASADEMRTATAIAVDAQGSVYSGGTRQVFSANGVDTFGAYLIRRMTANGAVDGSWQPSIDGDAIRQLVAASPNVLVVGGQFAAIGGTPRDSIAALTIPSSGEPPANHSTHARPPIVAPPPSPSPSRLRPEVTPR